MTSRDFPIPGSPATSRKRIEPVELAPGDTRALEDVVRGLAEAAYTRVDMVERRGEFAVRGGILDVFPPTEEHPVRVDFFGDDVDEIRTFAVADQRSFGDPLAEVVASPCRELLITDAVKARAAELADATSSRSSTRSTTASCPAPGT